jgi:hypothetical protein
MKSVSTELALTGARQMTKVTYEMVQTMINDGAPEAEVSAILDADSTPLTDKQIADLSAQLDAREIQAEDDAEAEINKASLGS